MKITKTQEKSISIRKYTKGKSMQTIHEQKRTGYINRRLDNKWKPKNDGHPNRLQL